jgi:hypothetical protein
MNTDTNTPAREAANARLAFALEWLFTEDDRWRPVPSPAGATIALKRRWTNATADMVVMGPDMSYAMRKNSAGQDAESVSGAADAVVSAVLRWPALSGLPT